MDSSINQIYPTPGVQNTPPQRAYRRERLLPPPIQDTAQPWTASRCHRLLRPLLTHITSLRKDVAWHSSDGWQCPLGPRLKRSAAATADACCPAKKVRHTYSQKGAKNARRAASSRIEPSRSPLFVARSGEMVGATPVPESSSTQLSPPPLAGWPVGCDKPRSLCSYPGFPSRSSLDEDFAILRKKTRPPRYVMYDSIFRALEALLRATTQTSPVPTSKSLLDMCLRKMPQYISDLGELYEREAEEKGTKSAIESSKATFQVYGELEGMGSSAGSWRHLRTVVRSHGVKIVKDAISSGLFDVVFSHLLVKLCTGFGANAEAEELLWLLTYQQVSAQQPGAELAVPSTTDPTPLRAMILLAKESGRTSFLFRQVDDLLSAGQFPERWLPSQDLWQIVTMASRAIVPLKSCDYALSLFTTFCKLLCMGGVRASRSTLPADVAEEVDRSCHQVFLVMLGEIGGTLMFCRELLSQEETDPIKHCARRVMKQWVGLIQACLSETKSTRREEVKTRRLLLDLTWFLSGIDIEEEGMGATDSDTVRARISKALDTAADEARQRQLYDEAVTLIAFVAHYYGRCLREPPRSFLDRLCDRVATLDLPTGLFKHMRIDAAFHLADHTHDLHDLAFAESLEAAQRTPARQRPLAAAAAATQNPTDKKPLRPGYRWEAGISEWVTVGSPTARQSKRVGKRTSTDSGIALGSDTRSRRSSTAHPARAARAEATPSSDYETDSGDDQDPPPHHHHHHHHDSEDDDNDDECDDDDDTAGGSSGDEDQGSAQPRRGRGRPNTRQGTRKAGGARTSGGGGGSGLLSLVPDDELSLDWSAGTTDPLGQPKSNAKRSSLRGPTPPQAKPTAVLRRSSSSLSTSLSSYSDDDDELGL